MGPTGGEHRGGRARPKGGRRPTGRGSPNGRAVKPYGRGSWRGNSPDGCLNFAFITRFRAELTDSVVRSTGFTSFDQLRGEIESLTGDGFQRDLSLSKGYQSPLLTRPIFTSGLRGGNCCCYICMVKILMGSSPVQRQAPITLISFCTRTIRAQEGGVRLRG